MDSKKQSWRNKRRALVSFFLFSFVNFYVELLLITAVALIKIVNTWWPVPDSGWHLCESLAVLGKAIYYAHHDQYISLLMVKNFKINYWYIKNLIMVLP